MFIMPENMHIFLFFFNRSERRLLNAMQTYILLFKFQSKGIRFSFLIPHVFKRLKGMSMEIMAREWGSFYYL